MNKYVGIWIDQRKAYIVMLNKHIFEFEKVEKETFRTIESGVEKHVRLSGGSRTGKTPYGPQDIAVDSKLNDRRKHQLQDYYQMIIEHIQEAKKILIDPQQIHHTIEDIADEVGYNSISAFNRSFKKHTGKTPSEFRIENLKSNPEISK